MKNYINTGSKDTRSGFGAGGMTELGQKNVVALCADLIDR
jgi:transketolase